MVVASLPATIPRKPEKVLTESQVDALVGQLSLGVHPRVIARRLQPHDRVARRKAYYRLVNAVVYDSRVAERLRTEVMMEMMVGLGPATRALVARSASRNVQAIKLLYEATGVHNTKVKHEHSGEIRIKFDVPRPKFDDDIVDADVVE